MERNTTSQRASAGLPPVPEGATASTEGSEGQLSTGHASETDRLRGIIEGTRLGTWEWEIPTGRVVLNERWAEICGYRLEDLAPISFDTWVRLVHPEDLERANELCQAHFRGESRFYEVEVRMRHKAGHWIWVLDRGRVSQRGPDGAPVWMLGTHQDISRTKALEEDLRHRITLEELLVASSSALYRAGEEDLQELLGQILRIVGEFSLVDRAYVFAVDVTRQTLSNTVEWVAAGIAEERQNLQNLPFSSVPRWMDTLLRRRMIHVPDVDALPEGWEAERAILEAQGIRSLLVLPSFGGRRLRGFIGFDSVRRLRAWTFDELNLLQILSDNIGLIQERVQQGQKLRAASEEAVRLAHEAEAANHAKSAFLANMSHEIRTPMNAILGFAQILERDALLSEAHRRAVTSLIRSGEHLLVLLNDVLDMSKVEAGRIDLDEHPFLLAELLTDLRETFGLEASRKGLRLELDLASELPRQVSGDAGKLRQVLTNLLGNAIKFTDEGWVRLRVEGAERAPAAPWMIRFEVEDSGPGIDPEDIEGIFDAFRQAKEGLRSGGTGLGLAISSGLLARMGGRLDVTSEPGAGARFECTVPLGVIEAPAGGALESSPRHVIRCVEAACGHPKVLVADDDDMNRTMLRLLLEPVGYRVQEAKDGREAVEAVARDAPSLILMDLQMPGMDGFEATRRIRATSTGRRIPILAVSASVLQEQGERIERFGMDDFIQKPFSPDGLLDRIAHHLDLRYRRAPVSAEGVAPSEAAEPGRLNLPSVTLARLRDAVDDGDMARFRGLVEELEQIPETQRRVVMGMAARFDYRGLMACLGVGREGGDD
jgi:PAS domain S-box-containing protein